MTSTTRRRRAAHILITVAAGFAPVAGSATGALAVERDIVAAGVAGSTAGRYIVLLKAGSPAESGITSGALARRYGGRVRGTYRTAVRGFAVEMSAGAARRLAADPAVASVEQDRRVSLVGTQDAPDWGLDRIDQRSLPLSSTYTSASAADVTAYVLDTGIRATHAEFGGRVTDGWDFVDGDPVADDCNGHGTHVAGTVGGATYGVAKDVHLVAVRVLDCRGTGWYSQIIAGVDWVAAQTARPAVVNLSLGGPAEAAFDDAVTRTVDTGVTFVVAAGNAARPACDVSPARASAAITVGATDEADARAPFSNYGDCLDLFAPGVRIASASHLSDTAAAVMSGTSMASPHVAGAAALVLGRYPRYTPGQVRDALVAHAGTGVVAAGAGSPDLTLFTGWLADEDEYRLDNAALSAKADRGR